MRVLRSCVDWFHQDDAKLLMSLYCMKNTEQRLTSSQFMRVHYSYMVNLKKVNRIECNRIIFNKGSIPIIDQYKDGFQKYTDDNCLI